MKYKYILLFFSSILFTSCFNNSEEKPKEKIIQENVEAGVFLKQDSEEQQILTLGNYENIADVCHLWITTRFKNIRLVEKSDIFKYTNGDYGQRIIFRAIPKDMNFSVQRAYQYVFTFSKYKLLKIDLIYELKEVTVDGETNFVEVEKTSGPTK